MIAADFAYYQPQTLQELPDALAQAGGGPYFFMPADPKSFPWHAPAALRRRR